MTAARLRSPAAVPETGHPSTVLRPSTWISYLTHTHCMCTQIQMQMPAVSSSCSYAEQPLLSLGSIKSDIYVGFKVHFRVGVFVVCQSVRGT